MPAQRKLKAFGAEPAEETSGAEVGHTPVGSRVKPAQGASLLPFGVEPEEGGHPKAKVRPARDVSSSPFGAESEEGCLPSAKARRLASHVLFGDEPEESEAQGSFPVPGPDEDFDCDAPDVTDHQFLPQKKTVFSLGWRCVTNFQMSSFWKDNIDDPKSKKVSRVYDNTKRKAVASYERQNNSGVQRKNGLDPSRLQRLITASQCQCA